MSCVTKFSLSGNQQARIDVIALQQTFSNYTSPSAELVFLKFKTYFYFDLNSFSVVVKFAPFGINL